MQITLANLVEFALADGADPALREIPVRVVVSGGAYHLQWPRTCASRKAGDRTKPQEDTLAGVSTKMCTVCSREPGSLAAARTSYSHDIVEGWVKAKRWLSKPTRAGGETQVKRVAQIQNVLQWASITGVGTTKAEWRAVLIEELTEMLGPLAGRLGSREEALAEARCVVAAEVGGDASLLDETPMLVTLGYGQYTKTVEALRHQCSIRRDEVCTVLSVPAWCVTYLLRQQVQLRDFTPAGSDPGVVEAGVVLYEPGTQGPHGLLSSALATARDALAV